MANPRPTSTGPTGRAATLDLIRSLENNERFRRDTHLGALFHPGKVCFREISPTDSLHIIIDGDRVSAHVDEISPLVIRPDGSCQYAWGRVAAHNVVGALSGVTRRLRGHHGRQRCNLHCHVEWVDDEQERVDDDRGDDPGAQLGN